MMEVTIKNNICGGNQPCAICGGSVDTCMGPDLFVEGTMQVVCRACGKDYAPNLVELLELSEKAVRYSERRAA
ncbi:MAG: hypothetical protein GX443_10125 [Deltaproteobacteria bacterium]|nr:hypothetical protein [Deltaproteobacteria bacterium]